MSWKVSYSGLYFSSQPLVEPPHMINYLGNLQKAALLAVCLQPPAKTKKREKKLKKKKKKRKEKEIVDDIGTLF